jgi:hypothetical protein
MIKRVTRAFAAGASLAIVVGGLAPAALAHEERTHGDVEMVAGFGTEPAYAGQPNSVQLILSHDGEPVVDLGGTLDVEVSFGDETMAFELEPNFAVGAFGEPGDYRAWFIPTRPGQYTFHFTGSIEDEEIDETFTSGPRTFSDVNDPAEIQFPEQDPSTGELAERIDREVPRLTSAIDEVRAASLSRVSEASDDAAAARTLALIGLVAGILGLIVGVAALVVARRGPART